MRRTIVQLHEAEYERAFYLWMNTPKWKWCLRLRRRALWKQWLRGLTNAVREEYK